MSPLPSWLLRFLLLATICLSRPASSAGAAESPPPNIVLIVSDDHGWSHYGFMGHPHGITPRLDKLAAQSLLFRRGYVTSSLCCPSLASLLTGRYPHQHRITSNDPPLSRGTPPGKPRRDDPQFAAGRERMNEFMDAVPSLPRLLAQRGYLSLQTGKWWQGNFRRGGFTHGMTTGDPAKQGRHGDEGLMIGRRTMQPIFDFTAEAKREGKPFFIWYAPMLPHQPHDPPAALLEKYKRLAPTEQIARYWAMIEWFDTTCGQLLDHLESEGLAENTIVVYLADNGWIQDPDQPRFAPRSKQSQYNGGLRTPILIRWPAVVEPEDRREAVSSIDIAPTLLRAAALEPPAEMTGVNLLDPAACRARTAVFGACFTHDSQDLERPARSLRWRWCVRGNLKLIVPGPQEPDAPVELYDLSADPAENHNLAAARSGDITALRPLMDAWWDGK